MQIYTGFLIEKLGLNVPALFSLCKFIRDFKLRTIFTSVFQFMQIYTGLQIVN